MKKPKARTNDLVIQNLGNETLVYDLQNNKAHDLNHAMSIIWNNCDGTKGRKNLAEIVSKTLKTEIKEDFIIVALRELERSRLLASKPNDIALKGVSRRKVLLNYALPATALPIVLSLHAPSAAQATSCPTSICTNDADCTDPSKPKCIGNCCSSALPGGCTSDTDCPNPALPTCDINTGVCVV